MRSNLISKIQYPLQVALYIACHLSAHSSFQHFSSDVSISNVVLLYLLPPVTKERTLLWCLEGFHKERDVLQPLAKFGCFCPRAQFTLRSVLRHLLSSSSTPAEAPEAPPPPSLLLKHGEVQAFCSSSLIAE
jgi:hypothetical protein